MLPTTEHKTGSIESLAESISCHVLQNRGANATRSLDALSHCFQMLIAEFPTLIIRWCRVRLSGGPPIKPLCHKGSSISARGKKTTKVKTP